MREAFSEWWVEPLSYPLVNDQRLAQVAFQAAYQLQQKRIDELELALELADNYNNKGMMPRYKHKYEFESAILQLEKLLTDKVKDNHKLQQKIDELLAQSGEELARELITPMLNEGATPSLSAKLSLAVNTLERASTATTGGMRAYIEETLSEIKEIKI